MSDVRPLKNPGDEQEKKADNQHLLVAFVGDGPPGVERGKDGDGARENEQAGPDVFVQSVQHLREAQQHLLTSIQAEKQGRMQDAKEAINKAIAEADKANMGPWREILKDVDAQLKKQPNTADGLVESQKLNQEKKEIQGVLNLAVDMRLQAAQLCLIEREPHAARRYLDQAVKIDPELEKTFGYKKMNEFIVDFSKGHLETVSDWIKKQGKELLIDSAAGGAGLCVSALFPQRMLMRRLAFGLLTSGVTRYGLRSATGEQANFSSDMMWGSVDYLAFASGSKVHQKLTERLVRSAETGAVKSGFNAWKANAAGIGTASLIYRGTHNYSDIGKIDEKTSWTYSGRDALFDTVLGAGSDSLLGASALGLGRTALPFTSRFGTSSMQVAGREFSLYPIGQTFGLSAPLYTRLGLRALGSNEPEQSLRGFLMPGKKLGELYERPLDRYQYDLDDLLQQVQKPGEREK
jgi:hypothetical protein